MDKQTISFELTEKHRLFTHYISCISGDACLQIEPGKWSACQQLEHIFLSVKPVRLAFSFPKFLLQLIWGKSNRPGRNYDDLVNKYLDKLAKGGKAPAPFVPKPVGLERKEKLIQALTDEIAILNKKTARFSESELDTYVLPHPLLGKLTLREMLLFCIYHVQHHQHAIEKSIAA